MASSSGKIDSLVPDYRKLVIFLEGWWLVKAEEDVDGRRLSVDGFTSRGTKQAARVFSSAPILKVYDIFTLETTDGIIVKLGGSIDKDRTKENGFPSDVFYHFIFGFPPYWEKFAENCFEGECAKDFVSRISSMRGCSNRASQNHEGLSEVSHPNSDEKNMGVEEPDDVLLENGEHTSSVGTGSSVDIPKECSSPDQSMNITEGEETFVDFGSNVDREGSLEEVPSTSKCTSSDNTKNVFLENPSISMNATVDTINSLNKSVQLEENLNSNASNYTVEHEKKMEVTLNELARHPNAKVLRSGKTYLKEKQKDDQTTVCMVEDDRIRTKSVLVTGSDLSDTGPKDTIATDGSEQLPNSEMDQNSGGVTVQADIQKNASEEGKNCRKGGVVGKKRIPIEASRTKKKTTIKSSYATPHTRGEMERSFIISPESFSSKRSRSGRLLLPSLEFWRNQMAIYDADRQVTGIKEEMNAVQPYRGRKSEPKRKRR